MIKVENYGSLSTEEQKDVLKIFLKKDSAFVSWDTPLSIKDYMYVEDTEDYEWIFNDGTDETLKGIVRTNTFLYCYEKSGRNKSRVLEETQKIYDLFFSRQFDKIDKKLLKKVMYYYALVCIAERSDFLEKRYKESIFCRNTKLFHHGQFCNEKINVLWFYISNIDEVILMFERHPRYEVLAVKKGGSVEDFEAAFEICENAESYDLYITLQDKTEDEHYANEVRKITGEKCPVFILEESDLL